MHLQCFTTTRYVSDNHYPICSKFYSGCLLALCGPTVHVATLCTAFRTISFFFCLVCMVLGENKKVKAVAIGPVLTGCDMP